MAHEIDLARIDLNLLVLFEAVMQELHVGRAAARLHLSPSAISHGLTRLRHMLHDPLFLKHPKGVVASERAGQLAGPISEILQRVRSVVAGAEGFAAERSTRRFTIGGPDAVLAVVLPPLLAALAKLGPTVDLCTRLVLPQTTIAELDARQADLVVGPLADVPARFATARLYDEEFCLALRAGHPIGARPTLARYCAASHVMVSLTGEPYGMVDMELKKHGLTRRIGVTVPNFLLALALVAETDLVAAVPRHAAAHAHRLGLVLADPPAPLAPLARSPINVTATRAALEDAGVAWLFRVVSECFGPRSGSRARPTRAARR